MGFLGAVHVARAEKARLADTSARSRSLVKIELINSIDGPG
jgi:hypothetical protein